MSRIVVIGALVYDLVFGVPDWVQPNRAVHATRLTISPGGKGLNQAAAASLLGAESVRLVGCVGDDIFGAEMVNALRDVGVDTAHTHVHPSARSSIAAIIVRDQLPGFIGAPDASRRISEPQVRDALADIHAGDVVLIGFEAPQAIVTFALEVARNAGATTVVNPAPFFTREHFVADYLPLVDWLIPNKHEAQLLLDSDSEDVDALGHGLLARGVGQVALTLGEAGSIVYMEDRKLKQRAFSVDAIDTTGASDAYAGAFCVGLAKGWPVEKTLAFASAAAAMTCAKRGTMTALPTLREVEALLAAQPMPTTRV